MQRGGLFYLSREPHLIYQIFPLKEDDIQVHAYDFGGDIAVSYDRLTVDMSTHCQPENL